MMPHQSYMDSEIRAIMAQYMPLDNQEAANQHHVAHAGDDIWNGTPFPGARTFHMCTDAPVAIDFTGVNWAQKIVCVRQKD